MPAFAEWLWKKGSMNMTKIVVLDGYTENPGDLSWEELEKCGELTVYDRTNVTDEAEIISRIGRAQIVLTNKTPLTKNVIDSCPQLRFIGILATGYNVVDVKYAKQRNIPVSNIPAYGTMAVGQFAIALLLELCHHIGYHSQKVAEGKWTDCRDWCFWYYPLIELAGKTMGIIGFGRIGQTTGKIAKALGMKVIAYDREPSMTGMESAAYVTLKELLKRSDVISLHCPLFSETEGIICNENIDNMKDGVIIINNSRGGLIVEKDLAEALTRGKVAAAAVDVVSTEPVRADNPLLKAPNCLITPHISWASKESRQRIMEMCAENVRAFLEGKPIRVVNHPQQ